MIFRLLFPVPQDGAKRGELAFHPNPVAVLEGTPCARFNRFARSLLQLGDRFTVAP